MKELIKGQKVSMENLLTDLTLLPSSIKPHVMHLNLYWDYFNYTLLEMIIKVYGSETLKKQMKSYSFDMQQFWQKTMVANFISYCKKMQKFEIIPKEFVQVEVKDAIDKPISEYTLMELEELKCRLYLSCQLPNFALILYDLKEGCVEVTWLVATELEKELKEALRRELSGQLEKETQQIVSISVGGEYIKEVSKINFGHQILHIVICIQVNAKVVFPFPADHSALFSMLPSILFPTLWPPAMSPPHILLLGRTGSEQSLVIGSLDKDDTLTLPIP